MDKSMVEFFKDEIEGYFDYMEVANYQTDARLKNMFSQMANNELEHAKNILNSSNEVKEYVNSIDDELEHLNNIKQLYNRLK